MSTICLASDIDWLLEVGHSRPIKKTLLICRLASCFEVSLVAYGCFHVSGYSRRSTWSVPAVIGKCCSCNVYWHLSPFLSFQENMSEICSTSTWNFRLINTLEFLQWIQWRGATLPTGLDHTSIPYHWGLESHDFPEYTSLHSSCEFMIFMAGTSFLMQMYIFYKNLY